MTLYDCTHQIETGMQTYPGDPDVSLSPHATHDVDGYRVTAVTLGSHTGTHIDAPHHTEDDGSTLGTFDVETFRFDARVVDCTDVDACAPIPVDAIPETDAELLVFRTGWDEHWGIDRYLDHPYLAPDTARRCVERGHHVALDTLNPDPTPTDRASSEESPGVPAHKALLGAGRLIIENLTGLHRLPERVTLHAYPLALDGDGAPIRAVAMSSPERAQTEQSVV